jgi:hypothetical protein
MRAIIVLLLGVLVTCAFEGCSSGDSQNSGPLKGAHDAGALGTGGGGPGCNLAFCQAMGTGTACCAGNHCGTNFGTGCLVTAQHDAGN